MKNQYVGDIGDYGKYGLFRFLSNNGFRIGVNWYLTRDDEVVTDGNIRGYLNDEEEGIYDREVFDALRGLKRRDILLVEKTGIIPSAIFYSELLSTGSSSVNERKTIRDAWFKKSIDELINTDLIFADPDNGSIGDEAAMRKSGEKYVSLGELKQYYDLGKDVVYYCHKARRKPDKWQQKKLELTELCPDVKVIVLTFRRGPQRSYIFGIHPENYERYNTAITSFLQTNWGTVSVGGKNIPFFRETLQAEYM